VDAGLIVQLLVNLFDNIAKYTPVGTHVTVTAARTDDWVQVAVDDDGPGLPEEDRARIFEKFQRGDREGAVTGIGLGLAICRAIVRAHGGDITAQAAPSGGARIEGLVTIGSLIGRSEIRRLLLTPGRGGSGGPADPSLPPERVRAWVNVRDPADPFASPLTGIRGDPETVIDRVTERRVGGDPHDPARYLIDPATARSVWTMWCGAGPVARTEPACRTVAA